MLRIGQNVFLQLDGKSRRTLHPSQVVEVTPNALTIEMDESIFSFDVEGDCWTIEAAQEILIYYNLDGKFVKQTARIDEEFEAEHEENDDNKDDQKKVFVKMEPMGEPVSSESRQFHRVSTVFEELSASFGQCDDCKIVDVSITGFALISPEEFPVGKVVTATARYKDLQPTGSVCIHSVRALRNGHFRYGLHCVEKSFQEQLQKLSMDVQRQILRRLTSRT